jgi:hypothetical protein
MFEVEGGASVFESFPAIGWGWGYLCGGGLISRPGVLVFGVVGAAGEGVVAGVLYSAGL